MRRGSFLILVVVSAAAASASQLRHPGTAAADRVARTMTLADARPVLAALGERVPAALRDGPGEADAKWSAWVEQRRSDIRARMAKGDEDSLVNLLLYGTTFTRWPRATPDAIGASAAGVRLDEVMDGRVTDLLAAVESPGRDERLQLARLVIERHGIAVGPRTRDAARRYLVDLRSRVLSDNERYRQRQAAASLADESQRTAANATLYQDRGLSSDTSLRVDFALEQALTALRDRGELTRAAVERVAVVGPGLDFVDKAQGYDFYPVQTIQPFAVADSLLRLRIAEHLAITALDVSPRVVAHLRDVRLRAARGERYRLHVLLEHESPRSRLDPALVEYWRRFGDHLGTGTAGEVPAAYAGHLRARTVALRPEAVLDVTGAEVNIVLERLSSAEVTSPFDLVVATNVLIYYDPFEQAMAVSNMAGMLRGRGLLLTNQPIPVPAACGLSPVLIMSVAFGRVESGAGSHERGDSIYVYRKGPVSADSLVAGRPHGRP